MVIKAIIPAAGYGTRNLPISKAIPKEMFPIYGRPAIDYIVSEAINAGVKELLIIISRNKTAIMDYFDRSLELEHHLLTKQRTDLADRIVLPDIKIQYIRQTEIKGLGHAVQLGKSFAGNEPVAVLLPDQISPNQTPSSLSAMIELYEQKGKSVIGLHKVPRKLLSSYGVAAGEWKGDSSYQLRSIVEKPKSNPPSQLAIVGRYILTPDIFPLLEHTAKDQGGEIQLSDALNRLCETTEVYGYEFKQKWYDISVEREYLNFQRLIYSQHNKKR